MQLLPGNIFLIYRFYSKLLSPDNKRATGTPIGVPVHTL